MTQSKNLINHSSSDKPLLKEVENHHIEIKINDNLMEYGSNLLQSPIPHFQNLKQQKNGSNNKLPFIKVSNNLVVTKSRRGGSVERRVVQKNSNISNPSTIPIKKTKTTTGSSNVISFNRKDTIMKKTNKK
jgi:hypothetical protein